VCACWTEITHTHPGVTLTERGSATRVGKAVEIRSAEDKILKKSAHHQMYKAKNECSAVHGIHDSLQLTATQSNSLQLIATHCNTLHESLENSTLSSTNTVLFLRISAKRSKSALLKTFFPTIQHTPE